MFKKFFLSLVLVLGLSASSFAQTATVKVGWDQPNTLSEAQGYTYVIKVNALPVQLLLTTCVAGTPPSTTPACTAPAPVGLKAGDSIIVIATNGITTAASDPFIIPAGPTKPTLIKLVVTYTIP